MDSIDPEAWARLIDLMKAKIALVVKHFDDTDWDITQRYVDVFTRSEELWHEYADRVENDPEPRGWEYNIYTAALLITSACKAYGEGSDTWLNTWWTQNTSTN